MWPKSLFLIVITRKEVVIRSNKFTPHQNAQERKWDWGQNATVLWRLNLHFFHTYDCTSPLVTNIGLKHPTFGRLVASLWLSKARKWRRFERGLLFFLSYRVLIFRFWGSRDAMAIFFSMLHIWVGGESWEDGEKENRERDGR